MPQPTLGPWATAAVNQRYAELAARSADLAPQQRLQHIGALVAGQARLVDRECLNLNPATNTQNPYAAVLMASGIGSRPSLGHPGDKYETGLGPAEELEVIASETARRVFRAAYAETRLLSGAMANLAVFMAAARPGDVIFTLPPAAGGHATHQGFGAGARASAASENAGTRWQPASEAQPSEHAGTRLPARAAPRSGPQAPAPVGAAGLYGLDARPIPLRTDESSATWQIDLDALAAQVAAARPRLLALGGSLAFAPYPIRQVRAIAESVGARLLFDAAHLSLLIAGQAFQQPLLEGADVITTSTYKALGGPPGGLLLTNDPELARRIDAIVYPGLTANNDLGRVAALAVCLNDLLVYGQAYAARCVETARALAQALAATGLPVAGHPPAYTGTHHLALDARRWGGGTRAARLLEPANILATGIGLPLPEIPGDQNGLRLGVQELARWGLSPHEMPQVASFLARILLDAEPAASLRDEVVRFRARFQQLHYVLPAPD